MNISQKADGSYRPLHGYYFSKVIDKRHEFGDRTIVRHADSSFDRRATV